MNDRRWIFLQGCPAGTVMVMDDVLPDGFYGENYSATITVTGNGVGPFTFYILDGELPTGLALDKNTGTITGILL